MVWLAGLITLLSIVLWVYAFFDALTTPAEEVRTLPKLLWLIAIVVFTPVGPLLWLFLGRPRVAAPPAAAPPAQGVPSFEHIDPSDITASPGNPTPIGPEDDPEFLRDLNRRIRPEED
ncbi:PLDc_N domain-containing protein [Nocardiopsis sp. CNT-189]|uniref:PLD nuclease N-terminal domain-containing protein n=1 Tax=Nocardiopsis oceanisediminis TaxID=2816862 RepID=UPI003B3833E6